MSQKLERVINSIKDFAEGAAILAVILLLALAFLAHFLFDIRNAILPLIDSLELLFINSPLIGIGVAVVILFVIIVVTLYRKITGSKLTPPVLAVLWQGFAMVAAVSLMLGCIIGAALFVNFVFS